METTCKNKRKNRHFICDLFGVDFLMCIYSLHLIEEQDYGPLFLVLSLHFCFKIHNKCLMILVLFQIGSKCLHLSLSLYVDTRINVKKKLQASNNIGCPGFTFHCLNTHLPKLNITIPCVYNLPDYIPF